MANKIIEEGVLVSQEAIPIVAGERYNFSVTGFTDQSVFLEIYDGTTWNAIHSDAKTADWFDCVATVGDQIRFNITAGTSTGLVLSISRSRS